MIPAEAARIAEEFRTRLPELLGDRLFGLYLTGSAVGGDFDPEVSDIDLLAVTEALVLDHFDAFHAMHEEILAAHPRWRNRIEIAYVPAETLRVYRTERTPILITSPGEPFHVRETGPEWTIGWIVAGETGIALLGPPPSTFIAPIAKEEYRQAVHEQAEDWRGWAREIDSPGYASYAVLTACRALYSHTFGEQASKLRAAGWVSQQMPEWKPLIDQALVTRTAVAKKEPGVSFDLPATIRFVDAVADRIQAKRQTPVPAGPPPY